MQPRTDFSRYSHGQLYQMLHHGDERTTRSIADAWDGVGARLHEQAGNLEGKLARFRQHWRGGAAEQYQLMIGDLSAGLRRIGDAAFAVRDVAHDAGDALVAAKARMPAPVQVPEVSAMTVLLATTPQVLEPLASAQDLAQLRQRQTDAATELHRYEQAVRTSDAAHARAVAVMNELAVAYRVAEGGIPAPPPAAGAGVPPDGASGEATDPDDADGTGSEGTGRPVFGTMFTAGVAAAAAATAGRLGMRITPQVPGWAKKKDPGGTAAKAPAGGAVELGKGLGGGGIGGGASIGGGGGGASATPAAHAGLSGAGTSAAQSAAALRAASGAAGAGAGMMPFMPFMPFAPTGGDMGGARRTPPWLTETEDVWGESSVITPPVLGEDPPDESYPALEFPY